VSALLCSAAAPELATPTTKVSPEETTATSSLTTSTAWWPTHMKTDRSPSTSVSTSASTRRDTGTGTRPGTGTGTDGSPNRSASRSASRTVSRSASTSESRGCRSPRASYLAAAPTPTTISTRPSTTSADKKRTTTHDSAKCQRGDFAKNRAHENRSLVHPCCPTRDAMEGRRARTPPV